MTKQHEASVARLLVASDSRAALVECLAKAAMIEHYTGAAITAVLTFYDPIADEPVEWFSQDDAKRIVENLRTAEQAALEAAVAPWREHVADLSVEVIFERDSAAAICRCAHALRADLILKPLTRSAQTADFLHTPPDWQLMREAPCPVLFTRPTLWKKPIRVLAALDVMDVAHANLNREIVRRAKLLNAVLDGELHLATAYPTLSPHMSQYQFGNDFEGLKLEMRDRRREALLRLRDELGVPAAQIHVREGRPRQVIAALAAELDTGLTVVGTAARTGLQKLLIGNTAEGIVSDLATDLLTVRSPGHPG